MESSKKRDFLTSQCSRDSIKPLQANATKAASQETDFLSNAFQRFYSGKTKLCTLNQTTVTKFTLCPGLKCSLMLVLV